MDDPFGEAVVKNYDKCGKVENKARQTVADVVGKALLRKSQL